MDDSLSAGAEERTRAALRELADRFKTRIRYAGRKEKSRFAAALAAESAVPREIVDFALFGDASCERSTGANRNCLLLDTAGSLLLSVDDDTLCQIAGAPERETELSFFSGYDPTELWFFPDRARAIQSVSFVDVDALGCHEALLGSDVAGLGGPPEESGRVTMTLNGLVGDSGMASPRYYLTLTDESRDRLVASPEAYRSALESREILRCVRQQAITDGPFCMTTFLGLDNRLLLPPFFPVQRNSDGIFGMMLHKCVEESHTAFLPWILLHAPESPRVFTPGDLWADAGAVRMPDLVIDSILSHESHTGNLPAAERFAALGKHLRWLGSLNSPEFEARLRSVQQFRNFAFSTVLESQLRTYGGAPGFWANDVRRMIELMSKASAAEDHLVPRDLRQGRDAGEARRLGQELIGKFGELLVAWPALAAAATRLRVNGFPLAEAV
jgi:hypothetical protein